MDWSSIFNKDTLPYIATGAATGIGAIAASKAAGRQAEAAEGATELQRDVFDWQKANLAPYQAVGVPALNAMAYGMGLPGYEGGGVSGTPANAMLSAPDYNAILGADPTLGGGGGGLGRAASGAGLGATFGGPVGAGIGAAAGALTGLFSGVSPGDVLGQYDPRIESEMARIGQLVDSGQISGPEAASYMQAVADEYARRTGFGEEGQNIIGSNAQVFGDDYAQRNAMLDTLGGQISDWQGMAAPAAGPGAPGGGGSPYANLEFGQFSRPFDYQEEPGYQFGLNQGLDQLEASASARGSLGSGGTLKALERYRNDYATTKYNDAFNRFQTDRNNQWNQYASLAGLGQTAAQQANTAGANYGVNAGNTMLEGGNARAAGVMGPANAIVGGAGQIANIYGQQQQQQLLNSILNG